LVQQRSDVVWAAERDPRWDAVVARDRSAAGAFYYSVKTTGVYCRPCCAARLPNPRHVQFHATPADAERAGFRPCKRCRPDWPPLQAQQATQIARSGRLIAAAEEMPELAKLAMLSCSRSITVRCRAHAAATAWSYAMG
jgi:AraC family transcriptional regulator of adaptative response/methylated-DNA-[protein]-cysteine methyltransferase